MLKTIAAIAVVTIATATYVPQELAVQEPGVGDLQDATEEAPCARRLIFVEYGLFPLEFGVEFDEKFDDVQFKEVTEHKPLEIEQEPEETAPAAVEHDL